MNMDVGGNKDLKIVQFAESLKTQGKTPSTVESYCRDASSFLDYLASQHLRSTEADSNTLIAYQEYLRDVRHEKGNSIRRNVIGVRQFYRFLTDHKDISSTPFDIVAIPERQEKLPKNLEKLDIEKIIAQCQQERPAIKGARDAAMVAMLAYEGLKATELIALQWKDLLATTGNATLRVPGGRTRIITITPRTLELLQEYRSRYDELQHPLLEKSPQKRMFISFRGRESAIPIPHMTRHGLKFIIYEAGDDLGIKHLNAEMLRHYAVAHLIASGKPSDEVMTHLGLRRPGVVARHAAVHAVKHPRVDTLG